MKIDILAATGAGEAGTPVYDDRREVGVVHGTAHTVPEP
jgi:hypothetical protein